MMSVSMQGYEAKRQWAAHSGLPIFRYTVSQTHQRALNFYPAILELESGRDAIGQRLRDRNIGAGGRRVVMLPELPVGQVVAPEPDVKVIVPIGPGNRGIENHVAALACTLLLRPARKSRSAQN